MLICSEWFKKTQQLILHSQNQDYAVVIPTQYKDLHCWAYHISRYIPVVEDTDIMHIVPLGVFVGLAHLVRQHAVSDRVNGVWLVNNHVDLDTYWTVS
jgi:hypothetical protein